MIPSKSRAGKTKTDKLLRELSMHYCYVVEPQDQQAYAALGHNIMVLPENNQGITYARDFILRQMRRLDYPWFWMLDDDIISFAESEFGKTKKADARVLDKAFKQFIFYPEKSLYSLEMQQFAWMQNDIIINKMAMQCVLFNMRVCQDINYDLELKIREDYDLSLKAIFHAKGTLKTCKYCYSIAPMKSQEGGMEKYYNTETEDREAHKLMGKWPGLFQKQYKRNRVDVSVNWKKVHGK